MRATAPVAEIFTSFQGEGPLVGVRQFFVRVAGCDLGCVYCDTPEARNPGGPCRIYGAPPDGGCVERENPLCARDVLAHAPDTRAYHSLALTGGEPLLYPDFVRELAREAARRGLPLYLETAGHKPDELARVIAHVEFVSLDYKLPSTLTEPTPAELFVRSYAIAQERLVAIKIVVTSDVTEEEVAAACEALAAVSGDGPIVLQPVTPTNDKLRAPDPGQLAGFFDAAARFIDDVRVIPQCHRALGVR